MLIPDRAAGCSFAAVLQGSLISLITSVVRNNTPRSTPLFLVISCLSHWITCPIDLTIRLHWCDQGVLMEKTCFLFYQNNSFSSTGATLLQQLSEWSWFKPWVQQGFTLTVFLNVCIYPATWCSFCVIIPTDKEQRPPDH